MVRRAGDYQLLIAGLALILTIMFNPLGIAGAVAQALHRRRRRPGGTPSPPPLGPGLSGRLDRRRLDPVQGAS